MIDLLRDARIQRTLSERVQGLLQLLRIARSNDDPVSVLGRQYRIESHPSISQSCSGYPRLLGNTLPFRQSFQQSRPVVNFVV